MVKYLATLSIALTILLVIIIGGMIPAALTFPKIGSPLNTVPLGISWQIPSLLTSAIVCGSRSSVIAVSAYLTIGLFFYPVFHGGGSLGYLLTSEFGYLIGFIPSVIIIGKLSTKNNLIGFTKKALVGLSIIHLCGIINLYFISFLSKQNENLYDIIFNYTIAPLPAQIFICPAIAILAIILKQILILK